MASDLGKLVIMNWLVLFSRLFLFESLARGRWEVYRRRRWVATASTAVAELKLMLLSILSKEAPSCNKRAVLLGTPYVGDWDDYLVWVACPADRYHIRYREAAVIFDT